MRNFKFFQTWPPYLFHWILIPVIGGVVTQLFIQHIEDRPIINAYISATRLSIPFETTEFYRVFKEIAETIGENEDMVSEIENKVAQNSGLIEKIESLPRLPKMLGELEDGQFHLYPSYFVELDVVNSGNRPATNFSYTFPEYSEEGIYYEIWTERNPFEPIQYGWARFVEFEKLMPDDWFQIIYWPPDPIKLDYRQPVNLLRFSHGSVIPVSYLEFRAPGRILLSFSKKKAIWILFGLLILVYFSRNILGWKVKQNGKAQNSD